MSEWHLLIRQSYGTLFHCNAKDSYDSEVKFQIYQVLLLIEALIDRGFKKVQLKILNHYQAKMNNSQINSTTAFTSNDNWPTVPSKSSEFLQHIEEEEVNDSPVSFGKKS